MFSFSLLVLLWVWTSLMPTLPWPKIHEMKCDLLLFWKVLTGLSFIRVTLITEPEPVEIYKIVHMHAQLYYTPLPSFNTLIRNGPFTVFVFFGWIVNIEIVNCVAAWETPSFCSIILFLLNVLTEISWDFFLFVCTSDTSLVLAFWSLKSEKFKFEQGFFYNVGGGALRVSETELIQLHFATACSYPTFDVNRLRKLHLAREVLDVLSLNLTNMIFTSRQVQKVNKSIFISVQYIYAVVW